MNKLLLAALILICSSENIVFGHAAIVANPQGLLVPRGSGFAEKTGPCGVMPGTITPLPRSANVTFLKTGQQITLSWTEMIKHPGHFVISLSQAGSKNFVPLTGFDNIPENPALPAPAKYSATLTVPNTVCTDCTIQLIQVMTETNPPSNYYSCTDITISTIVQPQPPMSVDPTPTPAPNQSKPGQVDTTHKCN